MPVSNAVAAMRQAADYLSEYAATTQSAAKNKRIDQREFATYWTMLTAGGKGTAHQRKCVEQMKKDLAGKTMTAGAKELYDQIIDDNGARQLPRTPPRRQSGAGV